MGNKKHSHFQKHLDINRNNNKYVIAEIIGYNTLITVVDDMKIHYCPRACDANGSWSGYPLPHCYWQRWNLRTTSDDSYTLLLDDKLIGKSGSAQFNLSIVLWLNANTSLQ